MTNNDDDLIKVIKPFGPSIAKIKMPDILVDNLNKYVDEIIADKDKSKILDHGSKLAGNVSQEIKLENDFIASSGFQKFLSSSVSNWIKISENKDIKEFHKMVKKLEESNRFKKEQQELDESYQQSKLNKKEHSDKEK